jgi:uncharacterized protein YbbK (DUF523 family)
VLSRCLGSEHCRYKGLIISSEIVEKLNPFVNVHTVCPEIEIGLGVPRNPVRIVDVGRNLRLKAVKIASSDSRFKRVI